MDREAIELLRAQLDAHAEDLGDRVHRVADALAWAKGAVRRARRARARAEEILGAIERARRPQATGDSPDPPSLRSMAEPSESRHPV
jgi:hypothetical protein